MSVFSKINPFSCYSLDIFKYVNTYCIYIIYVFIGCMGFKYDIQLLQSLFIAMTIVIIWFINYSFYITFLKHIKRKVFDNN